jgi:histone H3/H4
MKQWINAYIKYLASIISTKNWKISSVTTDLLSDFVSNFIIYLASFIEKYEEIDELLNIMISGSLAPHMIYSRKKYSVEINKKYPKFARYAAKIIERDTDKNISLDVCQQFVACTDYILAEILEWSGNATIDARRVMITPRDICTGISSDEEISCLLSDPFWNGKRFGLY